MPLATLFSLLIRPILGHLPNKVRLVRIAPVDISCSRLVSSSFRLFSARSRLVACIQREIDCKGGVVCRYRGAML